ncbi:hypothetical protein ACLOJK_021023 [Asimina triloba]
MARIGRSGSSFCRLGADLAWRASMDDGWMAACSEDECFARCHGGFSPDSKKIRPGRLNRADLVSSLICNGSGGGNEARFSILGCLTVEIRCSTGDFAVGMTLLFWWSEQISRRTLAGKQL